MKKSKSDNIKDTVYVPQEDSYLLAECVSKYAKGDVLDMGAGSGIQGITALQNKSVSSVTFCDINTHALEYVKSNLKHIPKEECKLSKNKIYFKESDLFKNFKRTDKISKFDTIMFNPPYLPEDEFDDEKLITTGGKNGYELIDKFLTDAKSHLNIDGQILLLFSSLTGKGEVDAIIKKLSYDKNLIAKKGLFMEQLYVYLLKCHDNNIIKGHRGIVEIKTIKLKDKPVKVAIKRSLTKYYDAGSEAKFLKILNKHGIGPKLLIYDKTHSSIIMEYVEGQRILEYMLDNTVTGNQIIDIINLVLKQLFIMDSLKINKLELTNPYKHIIITRAGNNFLPVMIDFERCAYTTKPKNITQFIQFLCSGKMLGVYKKKNIELKTGELFSIAKSYKAGYDDSCINKILESFKMRE